MVYFLIVFIILFYGVLYWAIPFKMEQDLYALDENTTIYCEDCQKNIGINTLCQHFEEQPVSQQTGVSDSGERYSYNKEAFEELLITPVQEHPVLWDQTMRIQEKTKTAKDRAWQAINDLFSGIYPIEILQKKWKNLRDTYIKVKADIGKYVPSGSGGLVWFGLESQKRKKVWKHYESMLFLSDKQIKKRRYSNVHSEPESVTSPVEKVVGSITSGVTPSGRFTKKDPVGEAILEAIKKMPPPPVGTLKTDESLDSSQINPICIRISLKC